MTNSVSWRDRVAKYSLPADDNGCVLWSGATTKSGYPILQVNNRQHRVSRLLLGLTDPGLFACHTCDRPRCVAIAHLFIGTPADNLADMRNKGRAPIAAKIADSVSAFAKANGATSSFRGVSWHRRERRWIAQIRIDGRQKYLGAFEREQDAADAYLSAKPKGWDK